MNKKFGALSSSENPEKLADTVKGVILGLSVLIIFVAKLGGIEIGTEEITNFAIGAGTAVSSLLVFYGLVKKIIIWAQQSWANRE